LSCERVGRGSQARMGHAVLTPAALHGILTIGSLIRLLARVCWQPAEDGFVLL